MSTDPLAVVPAEGLSTEPAAPPGEPPYDAEELALLRSDSVFLRHLVRTLREHPERPESAAEETAIDRDPEAQQIAAPSPGEAYNGLPAPAARKR